MLGFLTCVERGRADALLADLAAERFLAGLPVVAMVRDELPAARACEMQLRLLPADKIVPISQDLGPGADGCTLDAGALEQAVADTARAIAQAAPGTVLILNKFGKQEAAGRGVRPLIGQGLEAGLRVVLSVPPETRDAFESFACGFAEEILPDLQALREFLRKDA
jgi:hypothetical protein